jgi:hypothetical protein
MNRSGPYLGDELGRFVAAADMSHISERALRSLNRNVLDTLGCAIAAHERVNETSTPVEPKVRIRRFTSWKAGETLSYSNYQTMQTRLRELTQAAQSDLG